MQSGTPIAPGEDILFLACTRPALWHGVPYEAAILNGVATAILFLILFNPAWLLVAPVMHYLIRQFISHDYNMFGILALWWDTKGRARNLAHWGGSSVSPLPIGPARKARDVRMMLDV